MDVGTGSGAIVVTLAKHLPRARLAATDVSAAALGVARANAAKHGVADRIEFVNGDLLGDPRVAGPWDVVVSNPPYVREDEFAALPRDVRDYEPRGWLVVEIGPAVMADSEAALASRQGLEPGPTLKDIAGLPRIVQARRRAL